MNCEARSSFGTRRTAGIVVAALLAVVAVGPARAEPDDEAPPGQSEEELAKKTQNPVADLISVPFQRTSTSTPARARRRATS